MVLCMTRPTKHPKSGVYRARVVVPQVLRPVVGKRELIATLGDEGPDRGEAPTAAHWGRTYTDMPPAGWVASRLVV